MRRAVTVVDEVGPVTAVTLNDDGTLGLHFEILASHAEEIEIVEGGDDA